MVEKVFVAALELRIPFDNIELNRLGAWINTRGLREGGPGLGVERHSREAWLARSYVVGQGGEYAIIGRHTLVPRSWRWLLNSSKLMALSIFNKEVEQMEMWIQRPL
jgi:hypothetical protein